MSALLANPRLFDVLILILFAGAAVRWLAEGNFGRATYWAGAFVLNYAVSFIGMEP